MTEFGYDGEDEAPRPVQKTTRKIRVNVSLCNQIGTAEAVIEVPEDATEEAIEEAAKDEMFNLIEWGWGDEEEGAEDEQ